MLSNRKVNSPEANMRLFWYLYLVNFTFWLEENSSQKFQAHIPAHKPRSISSFRSLRHTNKSALRTVIDIRQIAGPYLHVAMRCCKNYLAK